MVLIFSTSNDNSTTKVLSWLKYFNEDFIRINENEFIDFYKEYCINKSLQKRINSIWLRRWINDKQKMEELISKEFANELIINKSKIFIEEEIRVLKEDFLNRFNGFILGNWKKTRVNKLNILQIAQKLEFNIPVFKILSDKKSLEKFKETHKKIITKATFEGLALNSPMTGSLLSYTEEVSEKEVPDFFFPSFVQKKIEKQYEIRVFYLIDTIYSIAIFSQLDEQTQIDFRRYNTQKTGRTIPISLSKDLKLKIKKLMHQINLNSGSIDLIKGVDNKTYFLEVNPVGQYGMVSNPGNFNLNKQIAKILINGEQKN